MPEPTMHEWCRAVNRAWRQPGFERHVIWLAFENHVRVVPFERWQRVFAIHNVGWPAIRFTEPALIATAAIKALVVDDQATWVETLDKFIKIPTLLRGQLSWDVEELVESTRIARM